MVREVGEKLKERPMPEKVSQGFEQGQGVQYGPEVKKQLELTDFVPEN
jgi:hypothetical protein